ncbi:MAG: hypothetical protein JF589_12780 [Gemmatimonadetes bacterium]|jgi:hypothetical protein|nr:hypothetical protein [Gemmatimonadota bacterium]
MEQPVFETPLLSPSTSGMLAYVIRRVAEGTADPREVTTVLRRVCDESRLRPPEVLLLRIKELWTKAAGMPRPARDDRDRRYFALIGEALLLYFGSSSTDFVARRPVFVHAEGCGDTGVTVVSLGVRGAHDTKS